MAISRNLEKSLLDFLEQPSEIFEGTETEARLNWLTKPNFSDSGKLDVCA